MSLGISLHPFFVKDIIVDKQYILTYECQPGCLFDKFVQVTVYLVVYAL